jgi:hypothetical protein
VSNRRDQARKLKDWRDSIWMCPELADDPQGKAIAIAIHHKVDWGSFSTVISNKTLASITSYSERTVRDRVQRLIAIGFLSATSRGHGREWKLRELTLLWPAAHAGHEDGRPVPGAGHEALRPAWDATKAGTEGQQDRHGAPPTIPETNTETIPEGAASPSPAEAGSAAPEPMTDDGLRDQVRTLRLMRWPDERILQKYAKHGMTKAHLEEVQR